MDVQGTGESAAGAGEPGGGAGLPGGRPPVFVEGGRVHAGLFGDVGQPQAQGARRAAAAAPSLRAVPLLRRVGRSSTFGAGGTPRRGLEPIHAAFVWRRHSGRWVVVPGWL